MTDEERRLHALESPFMDRKNIVTSGTDIVAKYPALPKEQRSLPIPDRIRNLQQLHEGFKIVGGTNSNVEGSLKTGFSVSNTCGQPDDLGQMSIFPTPFPSTGACCVGEICSVTTEDDCTGMGGVYQGNGTTCDPNPCCCEDPSQFRLHIDVSWSLTLDDTRADCELHFSESGSDSRDTDCMGFGWEEIFNFDFTDPPCPDASGICNRPVSPGHDMLDDGNIQINVGSGGGICGCTCICGAVIWTLNCITWSEDCVISGGNCGDGSEMFQTEEVSDLTHPDGTYTFSDSHTETDYSWSASLTITLARLTC